jgi:hydroxymethylbilane synthase
LGTRGSALARWQADWVANRLRELGCEVELVLITTTGDVSQQAISAVGGQGLFTKELQRALLDHRIDVAVHSLKDLPTEPVEGLVLAAVPPRESPRDVLVTTRSSSVDTLAAGSRIGTGSRRRQSQLLHFRGDLIVQDIRGNVDTRLRKLDAGEFDALVLAEAGLNRLGLSDRITEVIPLSIMLPAIGQGALGIETRSGDEMSPVVARLDDQATRAAVLAERSLLAGLRGGCLAPVGAWGRAAGSLLQLSAAVLSVDGRCRVSISLSGNPAQPEKLGRAGAAELLALGAGELIADSRAAD